MSENKICSEQKKQMAFHEAAHAVIGHVLGATINHVGLSKVDVKAEKRQEDFHHVFSMRIDDATQKLAGIAANRVFQKCDTKDINQSDWRNAKDTIRGLCFSDEEGDKCREWLLSRAEALLRAADTREAVRTLAKELLQREHSDGLDVKISGEEATAIIKTALENARKAREQAAAERPATVR